MRPPHTAKRGFFLPLTTGDAGEHSLIDRIRERTGAPRRDVALGIGDDAAVIETVRGRHDVLTTDSLVEGVHFRLDWSPAHAVGRKAVLVNLSDLAAMGAVPRAVLLSLCLPPGLPLDHFDGLIDGVAAETSGAKCSLVGGNITASPGPLVINVTAIGSVHPRRVLRRSGGRPGDDLYVTGAIGAAAAGLEILETLPAAERTAGAIACVERYQVPPSRVACGRAVAGDRAASACMDLSDGFADAVRQLARSSGTGASIVGSDIPVDEAARTWWTDAGADAVAKAVAGGEDYELLFSVPPKRRRAFLRAMVKAGSIAITKVGVLTAAMHCVITRGESPESLPEGFQHFRSK
jgi:thiamine-monophosphate kinase